MSRYMYFTKDQIQFNNGSEAVATIVCDDNSLDIMPSDNIVTNINGSTLYFKTNNNDRWKITSAGHLHPMSNNAYDIGSAELKVRDIYEADYSDIRLKTDIIDYKDGLSFINDLRTSYF